METINMAELDVTLLSEIAGQEENFELFSAPYEYAAVGNQCYHIAYSREYNRGGIVLVGSGSSGATEWTDARSPEEVLIRFEANEMVR